MMKSINTTFKIIVINKKHPTMKPILYTILICTLVLACTRYPAGVEETLSQAGKNRSELEKVLRQQIKAVGDRPLLWSTLGQSLMRHGEWQEASIAFRAALKQRPDAFDYAWLADALDRLHQPEEAAAMRRDGLLLTLQNNPQP